LVIQAGGVEVGVVRALAFARISRAAADLIVVQIAVLRIPPVPYPYLAIILVVSEIAIAPTSTTRLLGDRACSCAQAIRVWTRGAGRAANVIRVLELRCGIHSERVRDARRFATD